jgi:hypothetical protein
MNFVGASLEESTIFFTPRAGSRIPAPVILPDIGAWDFDHALPWG